MDHPSARRVTLTLSEAWEFYLAMSWCRENLERDNAEFDQDLARAEEEPNHWVNICMSEGANPDETKKAALIASSLGDGRTSGPPNNPHFSPPERVANLLQGAKEPLIFGMVKEVYPPVFWYGEC
jgi:hypothetical protein